MSARKGPKSRKRQRLDPLDPHSDTEDIVLLPDDHNPGPSRHLKLWFADGTIVLQVEKYLFRIHRSILSTHSKVFRDMFALPTPGNQEIKYGCPLLEMPDDSVQMVHLLMTLYYPFYFRKYSYCFDYISAVLRLSTKYDIHYLRQNAIEKLKEGFPSSIEALDRPSYASARADAEDNVIAAINLARETNCPEILPCAFYYCSRLPMSTILHGDGGDTLSLEDIIICSDGRDILLEEQRMGTHVFLYQTRAERRSLSCRTGCGRRESEAILRYFQNADLSVPVAFELLPSWTVADACEHCENALTNQYYTSREDLWEKLPSIFGLTSWDHIDMIQNV